MSGHTPGPWEVDREQGGGGRFVRDRHRTLIADAFHKTVPIDERAANARLIAAAPELLAALKAYVEWFGGAHVHGCPADDTCDCPGAAVNALVNNALAKAEGR